MKEATPPKVGNAVDPLAERRAAGQDSFTDCQSLVGEALAKAAELHLLSVIDRLPDGYALYDADERLVIWNQRYVDYIPSIARTVQVGDSFESVVGSLVEQGLICDAVGQEKAWVARRMEIFRSPGHRSSDIVYDDKIIQIRQIKTDNGGTLVILSDVTEARGAERDLRIHSSALEQIADLVAILDTNYRHVFVNKAMADFFGKTRGDIIGRSVADLADEEYFQTISKPDIDRCLAGETVRTQRSFDRGNGQIDHHYLTLEPYRDNAGNIIGTIMVCRDITDATNHLVQLQIASSAIDQISERVVVFDQDERIRLVNKSNLNFHGLRPDEMIGGQVGNIFKSDDLRQTSLSLCRDVLQTGTPARHEYWRTGSDGVPRYWETTIVPYRESDDTISGAIATSRDMTEHQRAELARQRFQDAIENTADGYALFDQDERLVACNRYYHDKHATVIPGFALGIPFETIIRSRLALRLISDAIGREEDWIAQRLEGFRRGSHIAEFRESTGRWTATRNCKTVDGGTLLVVTDITESKRIEEALAESQSRFREFTELAADWFWEQDAEGRYTYVSESIGILTRRPVSELLGKDLNEVFGNDVVNEPTWFGLWHELRTTGIDRTVDVEHDLIANDGRTYRVRSVIRPIKDASGDITGYRGVAKDITEAHSLKKRLEYQANHDALTGLLNRRAFEHHLKKTMTARVLDGRSSIFCFIDLDQFKIINDTAGHLAGDRLLQHVADLFSRKIRKSDTLARLGGDEFGLLLHDCSLRRAKNMAIKLLSILNENRFVHEDYVFEVGASIGLTSISASHASVGQILAEADLACYTAKDEGRNRVQVYQDNDHQVRLRRDEMSKAGVIRWALDQERFVLFAQPIRPLAPTRDKPAHHEILLRMIGADGSLVEPNSFIPAAERYGLMVEVDRWVIQKSFAILSELAADQPIARININLSGLSLNEAGFAAFIKRLFNRSTVAPYHVCFEITETAAIRSLARTKALICELKDIGCRFALDDFGSGLSSFSYLKQLPVDYLKIDGSFIHDLLIDHRSLTMVEAIHQVAKSLEIETVAECVETAETADALRSIGIDFVQGHAVGPPERFSGWRTEGKIAV